MKRHIFKLATTTYLIISFLFVSDTLNAQVPSADDLNKVLTAFSDVVKEQANQVALEIIREILITNLDGKEITVGTVTIYLGKLPVNPKSNSVFFQKSCDLLNTNISLTDPSLLKTISQDLVEFSYRISLINMDNDSFENSGMRSIAKFVYQTIETMSSSNPDVHNLANPLIKLSSSVNSDFPNDFSKAIYDSEVKDQVSTAVPVTLTETDIEDVFDKQFLLFEAQRDKERSGGADKTDIGILIRQTDNDVQTKYHFQRARVITAYQMANANAKNELSSLFKLIGSVLLTDQIDHTSTIDWLNKFTAKMASHLNSSDRSGSWVLLDISDDLNDMTWQTADSDFVKTTLRRAFLDVLDSLIIRVYTTRGGDAFETPLFVTNFLQIVNNLSALSSIKSPTPQNVGSNLALTMGSFSDLITSLNQSAKTNVDLSAPQVLGQTSVILQDVANRDWVSLVQLIYNNTNFIKSNAVDSRFLAFMRMLMQVYQATSVDDAKNIIGSNLEDASMRITRFDHSGTIDVTCLAGVLGGVEGDPYGNSQGLVGLYAPLGLQFGFSELGIMVYPVDLGTYLTSSNQQTSANVNDAVRLGISVYHRWKQLPIDLGIAGDYKPVINDSVPIYRGFAFVSLELPFFMLQ